MDVICLNCGNVFKRRSKKRFYCSVKCYREHYDFSGFTKSRKGTGQPPEDRFWPKVDKSSPDGCWEWQGYVAPTGYGEFSVNHITPILAHRFSFELLNGPIPPGMCIDHLCRNRKCVNPAHMEVVTTKENVLRGIGRSAENARKTHCLRGHPLFGENLLITNRGQRYCRICNRESCRRTRSKQKEARIGSTN